MKFSVLPDSMCDLSSGFGSKLAYQLSNISCCLSVVLIMIYLT